MPVEGLMSQRTCGCGRSLEGRRSNAETCSDSCRVKRHRKKHPPILPGPLLRDLISAYARKLEDRTPKARESFSKIADSILVSPLADRHLLTITGEEWERWLIDVTHVSAESTRDLWRRYLFACFKPNPHFLADPPPRRARPPAERGLPRPWLLHMATMPNTERARLVVELAAAGFYPAEILELTLNERGQARLGRPAWGRRSMPDIPLTLQRRITAYASECKLRTGDLLFPISKTAIKALVRRWIKRPQDLEKEKAPGFTPGALGHGSDALCSR